MGKLVHFMGIGGSGMSAVAQIAHAQGYKISGCDLNLDSPYISKIKHLTSKIFEGHSPEHLQDIDLLTVTPAVFFQSKNHPEVNEAKNKNILISWQEFMGKYLHKDKFVICIAGTHGKSTTTALAGLLLEQAGLDPTVELGATVKSWQNNMRLGQSKYFISEADEYNDNFASYHPDILILNNIEMDHPEYFKTEDNLLAHFQRLVVRSKKIIYNTDSPLIHKLSLPPGATPYTLSEFPSNIKLNIPGLHNKSNALGIIKLAKLLNIPNNLMTKCLNNFAGLSRRIELLGEKSNIKVYDDYANHPSSFTASLAGVRELNPNARVLAIIEPHTFSRLRMLLLQVASSLKLADEVIITKIYASRELDPGDFSGADIARTIPNAQYIPEFPDIVSYTINHKTQFNVILVMGSGDSYKLSRQILQNL